MAREEGAGRVAVVHEDDEEGVKPGEGLDHADLEVREDDELLGHEAIDVSVTRRALHDVGLRRLPRHRNGGDHVGAEVHAKDEHGAERERALERDVREERGDLRDVGRERVRDRLLEVVENEAALLHAVDDGGEVIVEEDHVRRLLGDVRSHDAHRDADVGLLERGSVVDTVAGHGNDLAAALVVLDDDELLLRRSAREDDLVVVKDVIPPLVRGHVLRRAAVLELPSGDDDGGGKHGVGPAS